MQYGYESNTLVTMLVIFLPSFWLLLQFQAYLFNDYWEDIGTIKSFFDANLALTEQVSNITDPNSSIPFLSNTLQEAFAIETRNSVGELFRNTCYGRTHLNYV